MNNNYQIIKEKIEKMKSEYGSLLKRTDDYAFSALALKCNVYKNPSLIFDDEVITDAIVDGPGDGGADILINDPNSDTSDLMICQSKFYEAISYDEIAGSINKMISFYKDMKVGKYASYSDKVSSRYALVNSEKSQEEGKTKFVFYTSAPKPNTKKINNIKKIILDSFSDETIELEMYFDADIVREIEESESRRPYVDSGKILIDKANNYLEYEDNAVIVNISAMGLKDLYKINKLTLLAKNLRYYIKRKEIDNEINNSIKNTPEEFWYKNNGITIICDYFEIDGRELKLKNFSIINGGQTTYLISRSDDVNKDNDFFIPCKVIKAIGSNENEKDDFSLEIARATNSQKAIDTSDMKSNAPEQIKFGNELREYGIYYVTKKGEQIQKQYKDIYKNTKLLEVGKLCMSSIFQLPCTSRNKTKIIFEDRFYNVIFKDNRKECASIVKDMLYADYYFRKKFIKKFDKDNEGMDIIPFANNSRTLCLAYYSLVARLIKKNIDDVELNKAISHYNEDGFYENYIYPMVKNVNNIHSIVSEKRKDNLDMIEKDMDLIFNDIIIQGYMCFSWEKKNDKNLSESNFLKNDKNYYMILSSCWFNLKNNFNKIETF